MSEKSIDSVNDYSMPIDMDSYKYYIKSQNAVIISKMGDGKGFDSVFAEYKESVKKLEEAHLKLMQATDEAKIAETNRLETAKTNIILPAFIIIIFN